MTAHRQHGAIRGDLHVGDVAVAVLPARQHGHAVGRLGLVVRDELLGAGHLTVDVVKPDDASSGPWERGMVGGWVGGC